MTASILAQAPQSFKYQAVVRDNSGEPIASGSVAFQISILEGSETGTPVYSEMHTATTNSQGHVSLQIGDGTTSDDFTAISWGSNTYFMKIEMDADGGSDYTHIGTSQLLSVPYALHSSTAENVVWSANESHTYYEGGNVGIGTNTPQQPLHVDGNTRIDGKLHLGIDNLSNTWYRAALYQPISGRGSSIFFITADSDSSSSDGAQIGLTDGANPDLQLVNREEGDITFGNNGYDEKMRITSDGLVGIGNSNPESSLHIEGSADRTELIIGDQDIGFDQATDISISNGSARSYLYVGQDTDYKGFVKWEYNGTPTDATFEIGTYAGNNDLILQPVGGSVGIDLLGTPSYKLEVNGTAGKPGGGSWSNSSDIRLKNVHGDYKKGIEEIEQLEPIEYSYKKDNARGLPTDEEYIGFSAQEVQKVFPEAVEEGEDGYLNFNMHALNVAVINALKELKAENEALKERIEALENQ
jgi:hypothetical protein